MKAGKMVIQPWLSCQSTARNFTVVQKGRKSAIWLVLPTVYNKSIYTSILHGYLFIIAYG